ncbi:hypothetical protein L195_g000987 [Trifolium pratense]|uniref:Uncharacterized protein n=1 Tax=Trifolium pratense TaxID=57577 RepID=A0A2K3NNE9_TRIPR|nr:hypothetical protein L195_g000987 [Trifolium pratense]
MRNGTNIKVMSEPWLREEDGLWVPSPQVQVQEEVLNFCYCEDKYVAGQLAMLRFRTSNIQSEQQHVTQWCKSDFGWLKCNVDVRFHVEQGIRVRNGAFMWNKAIRVWNGAWEIIWDNP